MIKDLIPEDHKVLHQKIKKCSYNLDRKELSRILIENMKHHEGVGLSANQIGIPERAFVMIRNMEYNEIIVCFNPKIIKTSTKKSVMEEGCLSYPDLFIEVERSESIVVKYEDNDKVDHKIKLNGFAARVFLHEYDHMEGITYRQLI